MAKKVVSLKKKKRKFIGLRVFITLILILGGLFSLVYFTEIEKIKVLGESRYTDEEILQMLEIEEGMSVFDCYLKKANKTKLLPFLEDAEIKFNSLNRLSVIVTTKEVCSLIPFQDRYLALDKNGFVLGYENEIKSDVPISMGFNIKEAVIGEKINLDKAIVDVILNIYFAAKKNGLEVSEIFFIGGEADDIHIYLGDIDIDLGKADKVDLKLRTAKEVIKTLPVNSKGVLDLSNESDKYVFKNDFELKFYIEEERGFAAVDKNYVIKKISHSKFSDKLNLKNFLLNSGEIGDEVAISDENKAIIDELIRLSNENNLNLKEIDFNWKDRARPAIKIDDMTVDILDFAEMDLKILAIKEFLDAGNEPFLEAILNKNNDKYIILQEK